MRKNKIIVLTALLILLINLVFAVEKQLELFLTTEEKSWLSEIEVIRIAHDPDFPPIEFINENGEYEGIAVEYIRLMEKRLQIDFEVVKCENWDEVLQRTINREIDVLAAAPLSKQRAIYLNSTSAHIVLPGVIITTKEQKQTLAIEDLFDKKVAIVSSNIWQDYIQRDFPQINIHPVKDVQTGLRDVSLGTVDAMIAYLPVAIYYIEKEGISNLRVAGDTSFESKLSLLSRNDWPILNSILEKALMSIPENKKKQIFRKWINLEQSSFMKREVIYAIIALVLLASLSLIIVVFFNRALKKQVAYRTIELQNEIQERNASEKALRESEKKLRDLQSNVPVGVFRSTPEGQFITVNPAHLTILGYDSEEEILAKHIEEHYFEPQTRQIILGHLKKDKVLKNFEAKLIRKDKKVIWCSFNVQAVYEKGKMKFLDGIITEITEKIAYEEQIQKDLKEKKTLIRELYHRTKNNMSVISAMLSNQMRKTNDEVIKAVFREIKNKIGSMALVHQKLYKAKDFSNINLKEYIVDLIDLILGSYASDSKQIKIEYEIEDIIVLMDLAVPVGLIVNELISNVFRHSKPKDDVSKVFLKFFVEDVYLHLHFRDNGITDDTEIQNTAGLNTVSSIVENQLEGKIELDTQNGYQYKIKMRTDLYKERVKK
jgi:PAS domain S-box-containing protein